MTSPAAAPVDDEFTPYEPKGEPEKEEQQQAKPPEVEDVAARRRAERKSGTKETRVPAEPETIERLDPKVPLARKEFLDQLARFRNECPRESGAAWTFIANTVLPAFDWSPSSIRVRVLRIANTGGEPALLPPPIRGDQILGSPENGLSHGEAQEAWVVEYYHKDPGTPCTYRNRYEHMEGQHIFDSEPYRLDSYRSIKERTQAVRARLDGQGATGTVTYGQPWSRPSAAAPTFAAPAQPAVAATGSTLDAATLTELGYLRAVRDEAEQARREGRSPDPSRVAAPAPAASPQSPAMTPEAVAKMVADGIAAALPAVLAAAGIRPKTEAEKLAEVLAQSEARSAAALTQLLVGAGVLNADGTPKATPLPNAPAAAHTVENVGDAIDTMVSNMEKLEASKKRVRKALGLPEEDAPTPSFTGIVEDKEPEEEGLLKQASEFLKAHPGFVSGGLAGLRAVVDQMFAGSQGGAILSSAIGAAAEGAARASSVRMPGAQGGGGWGKPPPAAQ